ncbi:HdeD family acid-resistance protein [Pseudorhodobacter sp. W20_MBD10_FR17]|uniref:HdeD family acid-resistance protein n=1 Tax=Pseudorhodobacter sp. W20_MBD10_FR17 TaxID=3240266 RepID=UPI003F9D8F26
MENKQPPVLPFQRLRPLAWVFLGLGAASIIWPEVATIAVEQLIAWFLVLSGALGVLFWLRFKSGQISLMGLAAAALTLVLGLVFLVQPIAGARTLTMIMATIFLVEGALGAAMALSLREHHAGWVVAMLSAIATLALSFLVFIGWPEASSWVIGLLFGINLLTTGLALLALSRVDPQK